MRGYRLVFKSVARLLSSVVWTLAVLSPLNAAAQNDATERARELFEAGRELAKIGDYEGACQRFSESRALYVAVGVVLNLADCNERVGRLIRAQSFWSEAIELLKADPDERLDEARRRAADLERRIPLLVLRMEGPVPEGTRVQVGDVDMRATTRELSLPLDPGSYEVVVTAPGREAVRVAVSLAQGDRRTLRLSPGPEPTEGEPIDPRQAPDPPDVAETTGFEIAGWTLVGFGAAGIATWAVTGALYLSDESKVERECSSSNGVATCATQDAVDAAERGKVLGVVNTVSLLAGLALLTGGTIMVLAASPPSAVSVELAPHPGGAAVRARF